MRLTLMSEFRLTRQTINAAIFYQRPPTRRKWNHDRYERIRERAIELGGIEVEYPIENKEDTSNGTDAND
jgi:hypothetical protein